MRCLFFFLLTTHLTATSVVKEMSTEGVWLEAYLNNFGDLSELVFSDKSRVRYEYHDHRLVKIARLNSSGKEMYAHTYEWDGLRLVRQTGWFTTHYVYDDQDRLIVQSNPWYHETIERNAADQLIRVGDRAYSYNALGEVAIEEGFFRAVYDGQHNPIELNGSCMKVDEHNQVIGLAYDSQGNLLKEDFVYDEKNQLVKAGGKSYVYDSYGRRIGKNTASYLYLGFEEIASFENGQCKTLKIPGIGGAIAIEINGKPYAPVIDTQGIVRKLIDPITNSVYREVFSDVFGQGITDAVPYAYRGKRYDPETGLIYFGLRYYDPAQHRWLTRDPLGNIDHDNLYQYVYNNPLLYWDITGGSFWGYVGGLCEIAAGGAIIAGGFGVELITLGGFTIGLGATTSTGAALIGHGLAMTTYHAQDIKIPNIFWKETSKKPPRFNGKELGIDPAESPGEGFEWRGKGSPESGKGNWINPETGESLHPDHNHPPGKAPHWGYTDPTGVEYDLFLDGSWQ